MFENRKNSTYWTVEENAVSYYFRTDDELQRLYSMSTFFTVQIKSDKKVTYHRRSYQKLPEVFSFLFSIIKIVLCVIQMIFFIFINPLIKEYTLINIFYDTSKNKSSIKLSLKKSFDLSNVKSSNLSYSNNYLVNPKSLINDLKSSTLATTCETVINKKKGKGSLNKLTIKEFSNYSI